MRTDKENKVGGIKTATSLASRRQTTSSNLLNLDATSLNRHSRCLVQAKESYGVASMALWFVWSFGLRMNRPKDLARPKFGSSAQGLAQRLEDRPRSLAGSGA